MDRPERSLIPQVAAALVLLAVCGLPARWAWGWTGRIREVLRDDRPNALDRDRIEAGYYERILDPRRLDVSARKPADKPFDAGVLCDVTADAREYVLKPNLRTTHKNASWSTNAQGMRDRDRSVEKPVGTFRVALVGDSIGAGWGVHDDQSFTHRLEQAFARQGRTVEVLNFAVPGHAPGQRWEHFGKVGWDFAPDLILFQGSTADVNWDERRVRAFTARGLGADSPVYGDLIRSLGLNKSMPPESIKETLKPYRDRVLPIVYRRVADDCRARNVPCVLLLMPRVGKPAPPEERRRLAGWAKSAGIPRRVDLSDAFDGLDPRSLAIAPDDFHPNADGHARIASRLKTALESMGFFSDRMNKGEKPQ